MNIQNKHNPLTTYIAVTKIFFFIAIFLLFLFGFFSRFALPDERDVINTNCQLFEANWEQVLENGDRTPVDVPGKVPAEWGEVITLATILPQKINSGETLCFRPIWQDVTIYIDGELRQSYSTKDSRPFGINSPMRYVFVELYETDAGKELCYQFSSNSKYAGDIRACYIGDRLSIWIYLATSSGGRTVIAVFLLFLSIFCILVCVILRFVYKKTLALNYLAWTIFFCAFWMLSEIEFRQLLFRNVSAFSCYAYWSLMLIPSPLLHYINDIQNGKYQKLYSVPLTYCSLMFIIGTILQVFDIMQFVQLLPFIHVGLISSIICIIVTITIDTVKKRISDYLFVGIGVYGMLLSAIVELLLYYVDTSLSLGTVLAIGLLFLLIMAIIRTGQDLFQSEKKKQQAILAREAQAKFLANMSHEIRTPINAIIGMNEMILRENESEAILNYAQNIQSASNMLLGLVNDVLDFSKIESGQLELVEDTYSLTTLLQDEILLLTTRVAGKPLSAQLDIDPMLPSKFFGDELRIKQILTNLLSNAVKYTEQGTITLKAFFQQIDTDTIELCFSISDTGMGIKKEDLSKLFDSFKRLELTKNRTIEGTGLGLNIAKQLVDLMQGKIVVESEYGKGSTFTVSIPQKVMNNQPIGNLQTALNKKKQEKHAPKTLFTAPNANILIVDDNSMNLFLMKELLKRTKMTVDLASSGKECLELTKQKPYHIIFMDHMMPELDGIETLHLLRDDHFNQNQNTTVIALTANAIAGCKEMYLEYGFNDYFSKPVQADKLEELLVQHLPKELVHLADTIVSEESVTVEPSDSKLQEASNDILDIDRNAGLAYCLNSEDLYENVLSAFCKQAKNALPQLNEHFQNRDWKNYTIIVHGLKGTALNIGAMNFSKLSLQHELAGKEENTSYLEAEYLDYLKTLSSLIKKIEEML